jgi:Fe-S cluster biogenesis protein NfuA
MRDRVEGVLERVRRHLGVDGGDVQVVDINDGVVTLRLTGGCTRCPMSQMALMSGLEHALTEGVEGVRKVVLLRK